MFVKKTDIVEACRWDGSTRPPWLLDAIDAGKVIPISDKQATVHGRHCVQHCGAGQWIVKRGDAMSVYGDAFFKKHFAAICYEALP